MKIVSVKACPITFGCNVPLVTATQRFSKATGILVIATSESGARGFGYADVFPRTGETQVSVREAIEGILASQIIGHEIVEVGRIRKRIVESIKGNPRAKAALETALYDLFAKSFHVPLYVLFGGLARRGIKVVRMLGLDDPEVMAEEAERLKAQGYKGLKIKAQGKKNLDLERVSAVRNRVGEGCYLKVDANESYDVKSAIDFSKGLADLGVEVFEQPIQRHDFDGLREITKRSAVKIEADQAVDSPRSAFQIAKERAADSINTSIQKVGGFQEVRLVADICALNGIQCTLSNTPGSMLGDAAALHLAGSTDSISEFCELGEFERLEEDLFEGLRIRSGILNIPEMDGVGVTVRKDAPQSLLSCAALSLGDLLEN